MLRTDPSRSAFRLFRLAAVRAFGRAAPPTSRLRAVVSLHSLEGREAPGETFAAVSADADFLGVGASLLEIDPLPGLAATNLTTRAAVADPPVLASESPAGEPAPAVGPTADSATSDHEEGAVPHSDLPEPGADLVGADLSLSGDDPGAATGESAGSGPNSSGGTSPGAGDQADRRAAPAAAGPVSAADPIADGSAPADSPAPRGSTAGPPSANSAGRVPAPGGPAALPAARSPRVWVEAVETSGDHAGGRGFRIWRDRADGNLTVRYRLTGGGTSSGVSQIDITNGNRGAAVVVPGGADARLTLLPGAGYVATTVTAAGLGRFVAGKPDVSVHADLPVVVGESGDGAAVTFTRTVTVGDLQVHYSVSGTAVPGTDYQPLSGTVVIPDGEDRATVRVRPNGDPHRDGDATVEVTVRPGDGYNVGPEAAADVAIHGPASGEPALPAGGGAAAEGWSSDPVRYWDGKVRYQSVDLESGGFGGPWAVRRSWSNLPEYANNAYTGSGWVDANAPRLLTSNLLPGTVILLKNGDAGTYFSNSSGVYTPSLFTTDQLGYDSLAGEFVLTDADGNQWRLSDPADTSVPEPQRGQLKTFTDRYGNVTQVVGWRTDGKPTEVQRAATVGGTTTTESFLYAYVSGGTNDGLLASVTLRRKVGAGSWATVRKVEYSYYDGTTSNGPAGTLQTAVVKDGAGNALNTEYYRYYTASGSTGYAGGLKYALRGDSYARLKAWADANSTTVDAATDGQVAGYADHYFEYDSAKRATKEIAKGAGDSGSSGGLGTFTFAYTTSTNTTDMNNWWHKTVETLPDGNQNVVYTNRNGGVLLRAFKEVSTGNQWVSYNHYASDGRVQWTAHPSAVTGYSDTYADLLNFQLGASSYLRDSDGLFDAYDYYTSTSATSSSAGGVNKYPEKWSLRRGEQGTAAPQVRIEYLTRSDGTTTVYPLATSTAYRNANGTGGQTTSRAYTWGTGFAVQSLAITYPTVTTGQYGPGTAVTETTAFDGYGKPEWFRDAAGYLQYRAFDVPTGAMTKAIADVDTTQTGTFADLPSGWATPTGGGLHLTSTAEVDTLGRVTALTDPNGNVSYVTRDDVNREARVYPGWNTSTSAPTGPTVVVRDDRARGYTEALTMSATPAVSGGRPTGAEAVSGIQTLARGYVSAGGQLTNEDEYFDLTGVTYSTSATLGTAGTNFNRTTFAYDGRGRLNRTVSAAGTIYRTVYDAPGREASSWVGTDDTPTSGSWSPTNTAGTDLVKVWDGEYDAGGVGDGNLTKETAYPGGGAANRVSAHAYDWRDRLVATKDGVETSESTAVNRPIGYVEYDNLDEVVASELYDGDGLSITTDSDSDGVPDRPSSGALRARSAAAFDEQQRAYEEKLFSVDPSTGSVSTNALTTDHWYDARNLEVKTAGPGGLVSKTEFDGAGRVRRDFLTDGGGDSGYADADDVTGDAVLTQTEWAYDANGNPTFVTARDRFHDETGTGALGTPTTGVKARVSYAAMYYDAAGRPTAAVDVGTNGGSAYTRPSSVPSRSDSVLVTEYGYNAAGWTDTVTDPRGLVGKTYFDVAGRVVKTVDNYVDGTVSDGDDKTIEYAYDPNGAVKTVKALLTGGGYQTTENVFGVSTSGGLVSNDLAGAVRHPDKTSGAASSSEQDSVTVNQLGEVVTATDRNGTVHTYTRDVLGRVTADAVTTLGTGVDGTVRRIEYGYDGQGNPYLVTTYDAASGGNVVNQVQRAYNGLGQLTQEWQAVGGAVNTSTTPSVQYAYSFAPSGSTNHSRLTSITYPNGRIITFNYATGLADTISRLSSISDGSTTLESYDYLGLDTVVRRAHPQPGVDLTYIKLSGESDGAAGDQYTGLDAFGRVIDQRWTTSGGTAKDRRQYGYDRDSNRLYADNLVSTSNSELYAYDGLNQLTSFQRGTLNGTKTGLTGSASRSQSWDFDALGNFDSQTTDGTTQNRAANKQNEITSVSGATTPAYDANGNLTTDEAGHTYKYDAWNQLVEVRDASSNLLATYRYDGLARRVRETRGSTTTDLYYSAGWQVLEERVGGSTVASYVWSPVYVDALVARDRDTDGNGTLDERLYALQDANWNVVALVNPSGTVVERYAYDPYGGVTVLDGSWAVRTGGTAYAWLNLWQGLRRDPGTGLYAAGYRDVSATLGRALEPDPLGFGGGDANLYRWEGGQPTNVTDPSGLMWAIPWQVLWQWWQDYWRWLRGGQPTNGPANPNWAGGVGGGGGGAGGSGGSGGGSGVGGSTDYLGMYGRMLWYALTDLFRVPSPTNFPDLKNVSDFFAGWADTLTDGGTQQFRDTLGYDDAVDHDSKSYAGGQVTGEVHGVLMDLASLGGMPRGGGGMPGRAGGGRIVGPIPGRPGGGWAGGGALPGRPGWGLPGGGRGWGTGKPLTLPPLARGIDPNGTGRLRDKATGRYVSDPANPPSPYTFTDAQRRAAWRQLANDPTAPLTEAQRAEIRARGYRGPQRINEFGELETMELSHEPIPLREGGTRVVPKWPDEHAAIDSRRRLKKR